MNARRLHALLFFCLSAGTLSGCGKLFENRDDAAIHLAEENDPNAGVAAAASETVVPNGKDLMILSVSSISPMIETTTHTSSNAITLGMMIRSEKDEYSTVHLRELAELPTATGVLTTDSALGCHYSMANVGKPTTYIATLSGSCVKTLTVELPDHEVPRAFLGTTPLFSGEIELADLKAVYTAAASDPRLSKLLKTYVARLSSADKPLTVADVQSFMLALGNDARRVDAVAILAPRVSDAANAENLSATVFTTAANRDRAVKILAAFK
jgi:hypothetical protein